MCTAGIRILTWLVSPCIFSKIPRLTDPPLLFEQAYDIIMHENRTLRTYDKGEVTEDPLIVLACGHVLPMTSMDGHLELHKAYETDQQGNWMKPCQLEVSSVITFGSKNNM